MNLTNLQNINIETVEKESLVDLSTVIMNPDLEKKEKLAKYIQQIRNPYCFVCDGIVVKVSFDKNGKSLEEKLSNYFLSL